MTAVLGLVEGERVFVGADSCLSSGDLAVSHHGPKWTRIGEDGLVAYAGSLRPWQALQKRIRPFPLRKKLSPEARIQHSVVEPLLKVKESLGIPLSELPELMVVLPRSFRERLWTVTEDGCVLPAQDGMASIGSGGVYALGALEMSEGQPGDRILRALQKTGKRILHVRPPYQLIAL